jgi:two-component sensor histidine kinase
VRVELKGEDVRLEVGAVLEEERLEAIARYRILDTPPEAAYDRFTSIAARVVGAPIALFSVVDRDRIWHKSRVGFQDAQIPRVEGFCASCMAQDGPWIIENAEADPRTKGHPLVTGAPAIRFYCGIPLVTESGVRMGALAVMDKAPRTVGAKEVSALTSVAGAVVHELEQRVAMNAALANYQAELVQREIREDHIRGLMREVTHRSKNILTVVLAMARHTANTEQSAETYRTRLAERIEGLARTQDLVADQDWRGANLMELATRQVASFAHNEAQLRTAGDPLMVRPAAAQHIGMALQELSANAKRYGALSSPDGYVTLSWRRDRSPDCLRLFWREHGGLPVVVPERTGFGHLLLERIVPQAMDGLGRVVFSPAGLGWQLEVPTGQVVVE